MDDCMNEWEGGKVVGGWVDECASPSTLFLMLVLVFVSIMAIVDFPYVTACHCC